jgi:hypothetical protein
VTRPALCGMSPDAETAWAKNESSTGRRPYPQPFSPGKTGGEGSKKDSLSTSDAAITNATTLVRDTQGPWSEALKPFYPPTDRPA